MRAQTTAENIAPLQSPAAKKNRNIARERQLLRRRAMCVYAIRGMAQGLIDRAIADLLEMTHSTYLNMLAREMAHVGVSNRVQLTFHYIKAGHITGEQVRTPVSKDEAHAARNMNTTSY